MDKGSCQDRVGWSIMGGQCRARSEEPEGRRGGCFMGVGVQGMDIRNYYRPIARMRHCREEDSDKDILEHLEEAREI